MKPRHPSLSLALLMAALWLGSCSTISSQSSHALPDWHAWKGRFVSASGRVVAPFQGNISTSEGQGYGLLLAVASGDKTAFARLWGWTRKHLGIRPDGLFAWRWKPGTGTHGENSRNDAADGDLLIAWALADAGATFRQPAYTKIARKIARDIRAHLVEKTAWGLVIKPAVQGFDKPQGLVVNLSYWVFPAFPVLNRVDPSPQWAALTQTGLKLLAMARFGHWHLPPDWLMLGSHPHPAPGWPARYGYDAVRIPLYLYWARLATPGQVAPFKAFWKAYGKAFTPAWVALDRPVVSADRASPGVLAIRELVRTGHAPESPTIPLHQQRYYSATLWMLVQAAAISAP